MAGILTIVLGTALLIYPLYCLGNTKKIHLLTAEASAAFFMLYILITAVLYGIGKYSLGLAELTTGLSALLLCILSILIFRKKLSFDKIKLTKSSIFTILIIIFCAGLSVSNFEAFGMGQDEGVYQVEAINILYGKSEWRQTLKEWNDERQTGPEEYTTYSEWYLKGFDAYENKPEYYNEISTYPFVNYEIPKDGEYTGSFHGIPTYPSFLAMSAQIFGIKHMAWGNVWLFAIALILLFEILKFFNSDSIVNNLLLLLMGMSPEIVWVNMSTLTEPGLILLVISFLYFLLVCDEEKKYWLSMLTIATFSVYHVSIYTMIPWFLLIFWCVFVYTNKKKYILSSGFVLALYWIGFLFMLKMNARYTLKNYVRGTKFADEYVPQTVVVLAMVIIGFILSLIIFCINYLIRKNGNQKIGKLFANEKRNKLMISVGFGIVIVLIITKNISVFLNNSNSVPTFLAYSLLSGFLILPYVLICLLMGKYKISLKANMIILSLFWCVCIYSLFMVPSLNNYYYFTRYLAPYISIIIIACSMIAEGKRKITRGIVITGVIILIPFQVFLHVNKDDSRMEWRVIEDIMQVAEEKFDADTDVYVDLDMIELCYFPIHTASEANIYVTDMDYIKESIDKSPEKKIYAVVKGDCSLSDATLYHTKVFTQEDEIDKRIPILNLPTFYPKREFDISVIDMKKLLAEGDMLEFEKSDIELKSAECDTDGNVLIEVSGIIPNDGKEYYADENFWVSFHLMDENSEMISYDNARYPMGTVAVSDEAIINFDIGNLISPYGDDLDEFIVQIDLVHEGDRWKSFEDDNLPHISFTKKDNVWKIDKIY